MKNVLNIGEKVEIVRPGFVDNGLTGIVKGMQQQDDGTIVYDLKDVHFPCPNGGEGWDGFSQVKEGEYKVIGENDAENNLTNTKLVRAKFKCFFKCASEHGENAPATIKLHAVYDDSQENKEFFKYTPAGSVELHVVNTSAADKFEEGKEYYIDFTQAE